MGMLADSSGHLVHPQPSDDDVLRRLCPSHRTRIQKWRHDEDLRLQRSPCGQTTMTIYTQKITFDEMCASGARDICHRCWHNIPTQSWPLAGSRLAAGYRTAVFQICRVFLFVGHPSCKIVRGHSSSRSKRVDRASKDHPSLAKLGTSEVFRFRFGFKGGGKARASRSR